MVLPIKSIGPDWQRACLEADTRTYSLMGKWNQASGNPRLSIDHIWRRNQWNCLRRFQTQMVITPNFMMKEMIVNMILVGTFIIGTVVFVYT
jgi:hypothetical protein